MPKIFNIIWNIKTYLSTPFKLITRYFIELQIVLMAASNYMSNYASPLFLMSSFSSKLTHALRPIANKFGKALAIIPYNIANGLINLIDKIPFTFAKKFFDKQFESWKIFRDDLIKSDMSFLRMTFSNATDLDIERMLSSYETLFQVFRGIIDFEKRFIAFGDTFLRFFGSIYLIL
jgi:hypothetical protein